MQGIGYCTIFGWMKEGFNYGNLKEGFDKFAEGLAKHDVELLFYSGAFGVAEPFMYVQKFGDIHDWEKAGRAVDIEVTNLSLGF